MGNPLVSIIVITYNSSKYVLETLESARAQTYQNIELIVSDDGSTDDTVQICRDWLKENSERFVQTQLLTVEKNTGIPANCNRGVKASKGEWIKLIAGDDVLKNDCIDINLEYLQVNKQVEILQTQSMVFLNNFRSDKIISIIPHQNRFFESDPDTQNKILQENNYVIAPSVIISRELYDRIEGFDERFKLFEDITFWLNATKSGARFHLLDKPTVYYRKHNDTSEKASKPYIRKEYAKELLKFKREYNDKVSFLKKFKYQLRLRLLILFDEIGLNHNNFLSNFLYKFINKFLR